MIKLIIATISTVAYLAASFVLPQSVKTGLEQGFVVEKGAQVEIIPTFPTDTPTNTATFTATFTPTETPIPPTETPIPPAAPVSGGSVMSGRYIDVNLSSQYLIAFDNGTRAMETYVSTGIAGMNTPTGTFPIYSRYASQLMSGPGYYLPGVPYVQYFYGLDALHGAYWHNNFGVQMSHGCINLPIWAAEFLWNFATYGTNVYIHY